ncbi:hypothetical protein Tco_0862381 [Tanacetum coccineum]
MQPLSHLSYWKQLVFKRREDEAIALTRIRFEATRLTSDEAISDQRTYKGIKEATPDPLLKNVPVRIRMYPLLTNAESDDECPKLQSSSKILTGCLIDEDTDEDIGKDNQADDESDNLFHDEAIVDSQVAGDEAVPHSNDSIDNEADDEYDYSDNFIDDGPITKLLRHTDIVSPGPIFYDTLSVFNTSMETDFLSNPSKIAALKLMKQMADIYFTRVTKNAESTFSLSPRQMDVWTSQREDHTSDWLRTVLISGLGQTMNASSRVFTGDIYGDHAVSCAGIIAGNEVDIGLDGGRDKPLRPADMLLYSWDGGLDVCVDLTRSSPLTQTGMVDFVPGQAVIDAAQRKRDKYMAKCAAIRYGFLPFSFSSLGELEADAVTLLKRIRKFSMTQDIGARAATHIFNRISFAIAKGVGAQIVSRLPSNLL